MGAISGVCGQLLGRMQQDLPLRIMRDMPGTSAYGGVCTLGNDGVLHRNTDALPSNSKAILAQCWTRTNESSNYDGKPILSEDRRYLLVFDGAVYNIPELRHNLTNMSPDIAALSDEEVLVVGFQFFGSDFLKQLLGQFALALLDTVERTLLLARDEFGIKTIYYHRTNEGICFSSSLPALLQWDHVSRNANPKSLFAFLRHGLSASVKETMFMEVNQVPSGHYLLVDIDNPSRNEAATYASIELPDQIDVSFEEASTRVRELFLDSVSMRLRAASSPSASLSGGIDSTAIVMSMREILGTSAPIHTFSYVAAGAEDINEEPWIDLVNARANAIPHKVSPTGDDFVRGLESATIGVGEPLLGTSQYVQLRIFAAIRDAGLNVVLDGIGGDGTTAGHDYYIADFLYGLIRSGDMKRASTLIFNVLNDPVLRKSPRIASQVLGHFPELFQDKLRHLGGKPAFPSWLDRQWFIDRGVHSDHLHSPGGKRALHEHMADTLRVDRHARYAERAAALTSTESRLPFYYRPLAEYILSLPSHYIVSEEGSGRRVFRTAMDGIIPREVLLRKDKLGYQPPENQWMSTHADWVAATIKAGKATGLPINDYDVPRNLASSNAPMRSLVRCVTASVWATSLGVGFD